MGKKFLVFEKKNSYKFSILLRYFDGLYWLHQNMQGKKFVSDLAKKLISFEMVVLLTILFNDKVAKIHVPNPISRILIRFSV